MAISLRLSEEEIALVRSYAKLKNQSVSEVMRAAVLEKIETEFDLQHYEEALAAHRADPVVYSQDAVERELGLR